jgi:hypothetical protein
MKNIFISTLFFTLAGHLYSCETEVPHMAITAQPTSNSDNDHIIRWQQKSLELLNKQIVETNSWTLVVYTAHTPKKPQNKRFSFKDMLNNASTKGKTIIFDSNLTASIHKELSMRKRIRTTWQHIEPVQITTTQIATTDKKSNRAKL